MKLTGCNEAPPEASHEPGDGELMKTGFVLELGTKPGCCIDIEPGLAGIAAASGLPG